MAYAVGTPGKLHSATNKGLKPRCAPGLRKRLQQVNRAYAEAMQARGLLCKKCYPSGRLPEQIKPPHSQE